MSENTINAALRRMGYSGDDQTGHGFRSMASTLLNEQVFPPDVVELQLAHAERNKVRAAYNKAQRLAERRVMMQSWSDYLDDAPDSDEPPLTDWVRALLDRRLDAYEHDGNPGRLASIVIDEIRRRRGPLGIGKLVEPSSADGASMAPRNWVLCLKH